MNINLKKVISSVAALAMSLSCFTAFAADFSDVAATASYKTALDEIVALGIVNGYDDGTFKPDNEITRGEVTKMVVAAMGPSYTSAAESSKGNSGFADVDAANHWASGYISVGVAQKFINGMGDGTFAPDANVTYAQIVKMLVSALGYESAANIAGGYPNGYISTGNQIGVTAGVAGVSADTNVTRAQVAQLIANAIDVPLVVVTNWTTNVLTGEPVAETEIMDGTGEDYKTLLTEYHDTYKVKGRVTATHAQGTTEAGKVMFRVEYADNYDDEYYKYGVNAANQVTGIINVDAWKGDTAADDLLFTYAEALIKIDEDDEATIVAIYPYGKNDIYTLIADDYATSDLANDTIEFYVSETSSKTKKYELADAVELYVNGIKATLNDAAITNYIVNNKIGTVTLIDSPAMGSTSKDGKIDYIMVDVAKWAIVDSVMMEGDEIAIYLKDFEAGLDQPILLDTEDEDLVYSFAKDGAEVEYDVIKEDDVLLVTLNVLAADPVANSNFFSFNICDTVVEGAVSGIKTVDGVPVYTIAGAEYKSIAGTLKAGNEYKANLDAAGRIVKFEELASSANYAVIDRVYRDNNTDEDKIRIIKADGTREAYVAKDATIATTANGIAYVSGTTLKPLANRVVKYKTNSSGEINFVEALAVTASGLVEYNENSTKAGSARMSASTQILDLTDVYAVDENDPSTYTAADIKAGALASFVDGEQYNVLYGDKAQDGTYRFVIITEGNATVNAATAFAVIDNVSTGLNDDGSEIVVLNAYTADSTDLVELAVDEDITAPALGHGDVVVLGLDADGIVTEINGPIYKVSDTEAALWAKTAVADPMGHNSYFESGIAKWDNSVITNNTWARIGFGIVTDKNGQTLSIARRAALASEVAGLAAGTVVTREADIDEVSVANDVNVYVYDYNKKAGSNVSKGAYGNVAKTFVPDANVVENGAEDIINWTGITKINYAFYKVTNDEITDIIVIKPANN